MKNTRFYKQAELMFKILPFLSKQSTFALKGGTAINFFVRDFPRLSVDIDLTYVSINSREKTLEKISQTLKLCSDVLTNNITGLSVQEKLLPKSDFIIGLIFNHKKVQVKIEPNFIIRGTVFPTETWNLVKKARDLFGLDLSFNCLSLPDLYGGKICAALDRQHPRDLFDVMILLENEGFTDDIRKAFIVYLISHSRPMAEILDPGFKDISLIYDNEFRGLTNVETSLNDLLQTRETIVRLINTELSEAERRFILSTKMMEPEWNLLGIEHVKDLPAVKWKLMNLRNMDSKKHQKAGDKLKAYLQL